MRFLLGLSGGADSAAAALSLLKEGHEVVGVFLRLFEDVSSAPAEFVARGLGIPFHEVDAQKAFSASVKADFVREYERGRTPNPCALCNREIKARLLLECAEKMGCEKVATGHYASLSEEGGRRFVAEGVDSLRDQSYFLWRLTQEQLSGLCFPLAKREKASLLDEVRPYLPEGTKESREICFIPDGKKDDYLASRVCQKARERGEFVNRNGEVLARHDGIFRYTVGQRRGFGTGFGERVYVCRIEPEEARIVLGKREEAYRSTAHLSEMNFMRLAPKDGEYDVLCRLRYRAPKLPARLCVKNGEGKLTLAGESLAVMAPGQGAVCYDESGALLCGGILEAEE